MNNEPVAWLHIQGNHSEASDRQLFDDEIERGWEQKPLYTHPVKELTNKEILDIWNRLSMTFSRYAQVVEFARAILRKASEI